MKTLNNIGLFIIIAGFAILFSGGRLWTVSDLGTAAWLVVIAISLVSLGIFLVILANLIFGLRKFGARKIFGSEVLSRKAFLTSASVLLTGLVFLSYLFYDTKQSKRRLAKLDQAQQGAQPDAGTGRKLAP